MDSPLELRQAGIAVLDCEHKTPSPQDVGHPYIAIPDVVDGRVRIGSARLISDEDLREWTRRTEPRVGDVIVTRRGRVGDTAPIPAGVRCAIGQNLVLLRSDGSRVRQDYLRWAARSPQWWSEVERLRNVGAVFSSLNVRDIARIRLSLPPMGVQQAIAEVLDALDAKVAVNARLSESALRLADASFASRLQVTRNHEKTFADVAEIGGGGTPSTKEPTLWEGDIPWATPTDVTALHAPYLFATSRTIGEDGLASCASPLYPVGSILMTSRATIGKFAIAERPMAVNQGFLVVNAREAESQWWLFHQMRARVSEFLSYANGATFLELSRGRFRRLPAWTTERAVVADFHIVADALHRRASAAMRESAQLARLRDTLLPELVSGRLPVKDAEQVVGEVV